MPSGVSDGPLPDAPARQPRSTTVPGEQDVLHFPKGRGDDPGRSSPERIDATEYVARVLSQIPEPKKHQVRYYGYYSCAARGKRLKDPPVQTETGWNSTVARTT